MTEKRYQYYTRNGLEWTGWFSWDCNDQPKWQLKNKLRNEYREV